MHSLLISGYIQGSGGYLNPQGYITRAEFAQVMDNIIKQYIRESGEYTIDIAGNVIINTPGVTLKDSTITGDLIIGEGVGEGDVNLENVVVRGRLLVRGGGEQSIVIRGDSVIGSITLAKIDGVERVYIEEEEEPVKEEEERTSRRPSSGSSGSSPVTYTVTFIDYDGRELKVQSVESGKGASAPSDPTREGYTFIDWNVEFNNITSNLTVSAVYEQDTDPTTPGAITVSAINVTGDAVVGATLTATPNPDTATGAYQWQVSDNGTADWVDIGNDSTTYEIAAEDAGKYIRVTFTATGSFVGTPTSDVTAQIQESTDASLIRVLGEIDASPTGGNGETTGSAIAWDIAVENAVDTISVSDIEAALGATASIYADAAFSANSINTLHLTEGDATVAYIKVTAQDTSVRYYAVTINRGGAANSMSFTVAEGGPM